MATLYRARWVLPIAAAPLRDGWVLVRDGLVAALGDARIDPRAVMPLAAGPGDGDRAAESIETVDLGEAAILPGLVNAHTHLELSWMRGRVPPGSSMPDWAERLMALRRTVTEEPRPPIAAAVAESVAAGTALAGDVTNTLAACGPMEEGGLGGAIFRELLGFATLDPDEAVARAAAGIAHLGGAAHLRASVVPHAPYSVSPALFRAIAAASHGRPVSVHLGESPEEIRFLRDGTGPWRDILGRLGVWTDRWQPPGCGPVEYLERLGLVGPRLLAVHATQLARPELARLAAAGATVVACPRSNRWTGAGVPPVEAFYESGVRVAVGTDSLASVEDLNVFAELAVLRRLAPGVEASRLLASATLHGAAALGFEADYGSIAPGKRAALIAVRLPRGVGDVEEYLVGGIGPESITWLRDSSAATGTL